MPDVFLYPPLVVANDVRLIQATDPAARLTANFEGGTIGATVATGDAGDATAWNQVDIPAGGTLTYDTSQIAHGGRAAKFFTGTAPSTHVLWWTTAFGTRTDHYGRFYFYATANPSSGPVTIWACLLTGAIKARIYLDTAGKLSLSP